MRILFLFSFFNMAVEAAERLEREGYDMHHSAYTLCGMYLNYKATRTPLRIADCS